MKFRYIFLLLALGSVILLNAQKSYHLMLDTLYEGTVPTISTKELKKSDNEWVILDTREENEYLVSHIPGAQWVGYDKVDWDKIEKIPKNKKIVTYCTVGYRSERIGEELQKRGYTQVVNLYGGIFEWANNGEDLVDSKNRSTNKVHAYSKEWSIWLQNGEKVYE